MAINHKVYIGTGINSVMIYHNGKYISTKTTNMDGTLTFKGPTNGAFVVACINNPRLSKRFELPITVMTFGIVMPGFIK